MPLGPPQIQQGQQHPHQFSQQGPPRFPQQQQQPQVPYGFPSHGPRYGPGGPSQGFPPYGYPGMQYGAPPQGWPYPPEGQDFPHGHPEQFNGPPGYPPNMHGPPSQGPPSKPQSPAEAMGSQAPPERLSAEQSEKATVKLPALSATPAAGQNGPLPPTESKPPIADALAPPKPTTSRDPLSSKGNPAGSKSGRIMPAVPIVSPAQKAKQPANGTPQFDGGNANSYAGKAAAAATVAPQAQGPTKSLEDANRDARAAVAAAMAKLPTGPAQQRKQTNGEGTAMDNLTTKVNEMRTNDQVRNSRQPGTGGYVAGNRGGRGGHRGGRPRTASQTKPVDVPKTDYDFALANAKFNKEELKKEATINGSEIASPAEGANGDSISNASRRASETVVIPAAPGYNKSSSFFDDISSESKDRQDPSGQKMGGREFRNEERNKNLDTFGQGSVDNGYRGGFRGRGRGRGFRGRGRGTPRGRGGFVAAEG